VGHRQHQQLNTSDTDGQGGPGRCNELHGK
jgi:hypothetical protein